MSIKIDTDMYILLELFLMSVSVMASLVKFSSGQEGLEPPTYGFGDRRSTN